MSGGDTIRVLTTTPGPVTDGFKEIGPRPPTLPGQEQDRLCYAGEVIQGSCNFNTALTPRKSNLHGFKNAKLYECFQPGIVDNRCSRVYKGLMEDELESEPPLGYEPEGSGSPPYVESRTPPYLRWAHTLRNLLKDAEGVGLFRKYLINEGCCDTLNFWFACEGLKKQPGDNAEQIQQLISIIYRKFLKTKNSIHVAPVTRKYIQERLQESHDSKPSSDVDMSIFDVAQREVENFMSKSTYPNFLKSDTYLHYVQSMQNGAGEDVSSKNGDTTTSPPSLASVSSSRSSNCGGRADVNGPLATVMEDSELNVSTRLTLTSSHLLATEKFRVGYGDIRRPEAYAGVYLQPTSKTKPINPYHAMYGTQIPGSAQDSELQSLSSDAHTDETISLPDSSIDGRTGVVSRKYLKQQHRAMKQNATQNYDPQSQVIPRTYRPPAKFPSVSHDDPQVFAEILMKKLDALKKSQETQDRLVESLYNAEPEACKEKAAKSSPTITTIFNDVMAAGLEHMPDVQSILDEHVSRVWNDSAQHTPTLTPGQHTPLPAVPCPKSPERRRASAPPVINPYAHKGLNYHRHRKERDLVSMLSSDSGAIPDFVDGEASSVSASDSFHCHGKHSHHHPGKSKGGVMLPEPGPSELVVDLPQRRSKEPGKRSTGKKCFMDSSSSGIDSGVSLANEPNQQSVGSVNPKEKVSTWVLKSERFHPSDSEKESSSRHRRSSYSSLSATSPGPNRQSRGKKQAPCSSSRSGSLERAGHSSRSTSSTQLQPAQPIMGVPLMPMLPPPNTTTQLEEARRRLEDDSKLKLSKSKSGISSKERVQHLDLAKAGRPSLKNVNLRLGPEMFDDGSYSRKSTKKCSSLNSSLVTTQAAPATPDVEFTVVGYQFFGDDVPYLSKLVGKSITLKQFKTLITKKGNFRYFFKKANDEFGTGIVYEEVNDDNDILPLWEGKLFAKLEAID